MRDCEQDLNEHMGNLDHLSEGERKAAEKLIKVCKRIASDYEE